MQGWVNVWVYGAFDSCLDLCPGFGPHGQGLQGFGVGLFVTGGFVVLCLG